MSAHHLIVIVYQVLSRGEEYVEMGGDYYDQRNQPKVVEGLVRRLTKLGYWVQLQPAKLPTSVETAPVLAALRSESQTPFPKRSRGRPCPVRGAGNYLPARNQRGVNPMLQE